MKKAIQIGDSSYVLSYKEFEEEVDIDDLLKIDYSNIIGELITFPMILNRIGMMLAEMDAKLSAKKMTVEIQEAKLKEKYKLEITKSGEKATVDAINAAVTLDSSYQAFKRLYITAQKDRDYINSLFWCAKDKSEKLDKMSMSIQTGDVSDYLIEGKVNTITINKKGRLID